ncbi:hypothetical protein N42HA_01384 [Lactococcus lactis]|nr:hypothetical protein [Lactococcus lactis]MDU0408373.1 hypothetical protein [Lactococcus lactis]
MEMNEGAAMDNKRISEIVEEEMIKQDANRYRDMRKILTIPKSIADELDDIFYGLDATDLDYVLDETRPNGVIAFNDYYLKNKNIIALYLASRALGVDLVKVVEA